MAENEKARLFIGLPVSDEAREALWRQAQSLSGCRVVPKEMYHITLCFLGCRPRADMASLSRLLEAAPRPCLRLTLGSTGAFKNGDILWAGLENPPRALFDLQTWLARALDMPQEEYRPHITLARRAKGIPSGIRLPPIEFAPTELILYESLRENDVLVYRPRHTVSFL